MYYLILRDGCDIRKNMKMYCHYWVTPTPHDRSLLSRAHSVVSPHDDGGCGYGPHYIIYSHTSCVWDYPGTSRGHSQGSILFLQFPVAFLEVSGMKSILSTGPNTRCGNGCSTSWTPTSWMPAASLSRSLTSAESTCAAWVYRSSRGLLALLGSCSTATCSISSGMVSGGGKRQGLHSWLGSDLAFPRTGSSRERRG